MDITVHFPDGLGKEVVRKPNVNDCLLFLLILFSERERVF